MDIIVIFVIIVITVLIVSHVRLLGLFKTVFPYRNGSGCLVMDTDKVHSIKHCHIDVTSFVQVLRFIVHTLVGGRGQQGGVDALDYRKIKLGDAGKLGKYDILSVLPDKFARFLYEFHDFLFSSLDLPPLPAYRSDFDEHGAINDNQVWIVLYLFACNPAAYVRL